MNLLLADDHPIVVDGLSRIATDLGFNSIHVVNEPDSVSEAPRPSLAILDMWSGSSLSGPTFARRVREVSPKTPILFYTALPEYPFGIVAHQKGYNGWLSKKAPLHVVKEAIATVHSGDRYFGVDMEAWSDDLCTSILSPRELDVLRVLGEGVTSDRDIASRLHISAATVRSHISKICRKLCINRKADLLQYAVAQRSFL